MPVGLNSLKIHSRETNNTSQIYDTSRWNSTRTQSRWTNQHHLNVKYQSYATEKNTILMDKTISVKYMSVIWNSTQTLLGYKKLYISVIYNTR